jgi:dihydrodipicolinate synthase/N-acetylneuraminate lyase
MISYPTPPAWVWQALRNGLLIPAHPLALTRSGKLDERRQRALTRYYHSAGAGGIAVGVHTTQFEIRRPEHGLFEPVLELAARTAAECDAAGGRQTVRIAGVCGRTRQAVAEASFARRAGYHAGLLSLASFQADTETVMLRHCQTVAREIPIFGFYLQPAVGGRVLSVDFWRRFAAIPSVLAIKMAPFNRYQTLDVVRAVAEAGRANDIALYTGNDDSIVVDLLTQYEIPAGKGKTRQRIVGGLLGHWACWTQKAAELLRLCQQQRSRNVVPASTLTLAAQVTDCNGAFFDSANQFAGCIAGIHEVLRRQGLLSNLVCLDSRQKLSPGQKQEINRVYQAYPELNDDEFVRAHLDQWLRD